MPFLDSLDQHSAKVAFITPNSKALTYRDVLERAELLGEFFSERSLVLIIAETAVEPLVGYISVIRKNSVVMFCDIKMKNLDIFKIIGTYYPDFIFAPKAWVSQANITSFSFALSMGNYQLLRSRQTMNKHMHSQLSLLLPTSGSLGNAKFVRLSKQNLRSNSHSIIKYLELTSRDRAITNMPFSYSFMLSILNTHFECGASIVLCSNSIIENNFWNMAQRHKITSFSGVPFTFQTLVRLGLQKLEIPSLRQITQAGGKLSENITSKIIEFCKLQNIELVTMYGQTECSPRMAFLDWPSAEKKLGSIGKAIPNTKMWLENEQGQKITRPDVVAEIVFSGSNVCMGYAERLQDLKNPDQNSGLIRTGDLATIDSDGYFYIKGRLKRIAKIHGNRIHLDDIETKLKDFEIDAVCIEKDGKILIFYETTRHEKTLLTIVSKVSNQRKSIFELCPIDALPRTSSGKINYKFLERIL